MLKMQLKSLGKKASRVEDSIKSSPRRLCHPKNLPVVVAAFAKKIMSSFQFHAGGFASDDDDENDNSVICAGGACAGGVCAGGDAREEPVDDMAFMYDGVASLSDGEDDDEGAVPAPQAALAAALAPQAALAAAPAPQAVPLPALAAPAELAAPAAPRPSKKRVTQPDSEDEEDEGAMSAGMAGLSAEAIAAGEAATAARAATGCEASNKKKQAKKEGGGKDRIQVTKQFIDGCLRECDVQSVKDNALTSRRSPQTASP